MIVTIKRNLILNKEDKEYLLWNMRYRNFIYNKGIEYAINNNERFNAYKFDTYFHNKYEKNSLSYGNSIKGIRNETCNDIERAVNSVWKNRKDGLKSGLRFRKYNRYNMGFRVYDKLHNRISFLSDNILSFKCNKNKSLLLHLSESIYNHKNNYIIDSKNISLIFFIFKNNEFYISFTCEVEVINKSIAKKSKLAGIDLGETNPITLYNGNIITTIKFPDNKIKRLESRIDKLKTYLSKKIYNSINYNKLLLKINKLYERIYNIGLNWRYIISHTITNLYKNIIVDEFDIPIHDYLNKMNRRVMSRGMYYLQTTLKYISSKYGCNYYIALPNTTRTCSICGHVNNPLELSEKHLICDNCGERIHRDINASINCFNQYKEIKKLIKV